jgi:hypothetical protein
MDQPRGRTKDQPKPRSSVQALETIGLILIVLLILAVTITRSWHYISWSAR